MILDEIISHKRIEIESSKRKEPLDELKSMLEDVAEPRDFLTAVKPGDRRKIIAEIKKASPSKGVIREDFDPLEIAKDYQSAGACAISVLTDNRFFQGKLSYLKDIKRIVDIPLLRKDFIIDPYQVYESRIHGADAILLIASCLSVSQMEDLLGLTHDLGMNAIVEIHTREELEKSLSVDSKIIGINNRDLKTFQVDLNVTFRLSPMVSGDRVVVSESGITLANIHTLYDKGIKVFLIGESFMKAPCPADALRSMLGDT